ncbi:hypothetical protein B0H66DRAFT_544968 [Apodospora peruviana]|uniref:Uncharacterized protein n=1 Tax=Apodospora peruviana TaxID=516989 RepID=A0AAE0ITQ6_9PEZI|nr:hypothetical protein B0H66DRAFT_544968 [Apodospora peruviana]
MKRLSLAGVRLLGIRPPVSARVHPGTAAGRLTGGLSRHWQYWHKSMWIWRSGPQSSLPIGTAQGILEFDPGAVVCSL